MFRVFVVCICHKILSICLYLSMPTQIVFAAFFFVCSQKNAVQISKVLFLARWDRGSL